MNILTRLFNRMHFRKTINIDESKNVVDGMVKARKLYKKLSVQAHPDRNLNRRDEAEEIMQRLTVNKHNYGLICKCPWWLNQKSCLHGT